MRITLSLLLLLFLNLPALAALEWSVGPDLVLDSEPLAMVAADDGKRLFVLTAEKKVQVFTEDGRKEAEIPLDFQAETLALSKDGKRLLLGDREGKRIRQIAFQKRFSIPVTGAPFKGAADAAVAVVVFSDFQ